MRTKHLSLVTQEHLDTVSESKPVLSHFGPVRVGLITSQTTQNHQLLELLNSLESVVESLNFKSFTVYDTLITAMEGVRAALNATPIDAGGTKK